MSRKRDAVERERAAVAKAWEAAERERAAVAKAWEAAEKMTVLCRSLHCCHGVLLRIVCFHREPLSNCSLLVLLMLRMLLTHSIPLLVLRRTRGIVPVIDDPHRCAFPRNRATHPLHGTRIGWL